MILDIVIALFLFFVVGPAVIGMLVLIVNQHRADARKPAPVVAVAAQGPPLAWWRKPVPWWVHGGVVVGGLALLAMVAR